MRYAFRHWVTTVTIDGPNLHSKEAQILEYGEGNQKIQKQISVCKQEKLIARISMQIIKNLRDRGLMCLANYIVGSGKDSGRR